MSNMYHSFKSLDIALSKMTGRNYCVAKVIEEKRSVIYFEYLLFQNFNLFQQYRIQNTYIKFHEVLKTKDELLSGGYQTGLGRLVFDLDLTEKLYGDQFVHPEFEQDFEDLIKKTVSKYYPGADSSRLEFVWMSDVRDEKYSRHLVVKNGLIGDFRFNLKTFYELLLIEMKNESHFYYVPHKFLKLSDSFIDPAIPSATFLRMNETIKEDHRLTLDCSKFSHEDTLVRPFGHVRLAEEQCLGQVSPEGLKLLEELNILTNPENDPNNLTSDQIIWIMTHLSSNRAENTKWWISVGACVKQLADTQEVFKAWKIWSRIPVKYQNVTDREYQNWWEYFTPYTWSSQSLLGWFQKDNYEEYQKFMSKNKNIRHIWTYHPKGYQIPRHYRVKVDRYTHDRIKPFDEKKPVEVVRSKMDTYKTRTLIDYIKEHDDLKWVVYPTSRFATAKDAEQVFKETGRKVVFYTDIGDKQIDPHSIIIVQLESLSKLISQHHNKALMGAPDLLILDECTSLCKQFSSVTMNGRFERTSKIFKLMARTAKKIIALDADVDNRIIDLLMELRDDDIHLQWNDKKCEGRSLYLVDQKEYLIKYMIDRLYSGENIFIVCSTKKCAHQLERLIGNKGFSVRCHTSDEAPEDRDMLHDVNNLWTQYRAVIITSTITNGVNFYQPHFDSMFMFAENGETAPVRDLKQMTGRVRKLKTGLMFGHLNIKNYKCPISYRIIRSGIINRTYSYKGSLEKMRDKSDMAVETLIREFSEKIVIDGEGLKAFDLDENWIGKIHIANCQENNRSKRFLKEEFEFMITEQGIPIQRVKEELSKEEEGKIGDELNNVRDELTLEELTIYNNTPVISKEEAIEAQTRVENRQSSIDDHKKLEVYSVSKCFKEKPSKDHHDYFKNNRKIFLNILAERDGNEHEVLQIDVRTFTHPVNIQGRLDQYHVILELCQRLKIKNTIEPFTFNTLMFQDHHQINGLDPGWKEFLQQAQKAFGYGDQELTSVKGMIERLKSILKSWSGLNFGRGNRREKQINGIRHRYVEHTTSLPTKIKEILPQLRSWEQICNFSFFDERNPKSDEILPELGTAL